MPELLHETFQLNSIEGKTLQMFDHFSSESLMFFMCNCNLDRVAVWIELNSGSLHFILGTVNSAPRRC